MYNRAVVIRLVPRSDCATETLELTIENLDISTTTVNATITANTTGASYQWIDCDNGNTPIANQINQSFTPNTSGNYAVVITQGSCTKTSECVSVTILSSEENEFNSLSYVYPNPFTELINISTNNNATVEIYDVVGKLIQTNTNR